MLNDMYKSPAGENLIMNMGELTCHCSSLLLTKGIEPTVQLIMQVTEIIIFLPV
jgi:hypothetical protein